MRGRPPKKSLTPEQEQAASAFVEAAEAPDSGSGRAPTPPSAAQAPVARARVVRHQPSASSSAPEKRPWEADYVREDVIKGYALRLPEPLYLKLKWLAHQTGRSVNTVIREAVEANVEVFFEATESTR